MGDAMTQAERALNMHDLALSVVRSKGVTRLEGSTRIIEYRCGLLNILHRSGQGQLDVWFLRRVLSVDRFAGKPRIIRYMPGHWERHLIEAMKVAA